MGLFLPQWGKKEVRKGNEEKEKKTKMGAALKRLSLRSEQEEGGFNQG